MLRHQLSTVAKNAGSKCSKAPWTKLQQDNLEAKFMCTAHQWQGFNGLVRAE